MAYINATPTATPQNPAPGVPVKASSFDITAVANYTNGHATTSATVAAVGTSFYAQKSWWNGTAPYNFSAVVSPNLHAGVGNATVQCGSGAVASAQVDVYLNFTVYDWTLGRIVYFNQVDMVQLIYANGTRVYNPGGDSVSCSQPAGWAHYGLTEAALGGAMANLSSASHPTWLAYNDYLTITVRLIGVVTADISNPGSSGTTTAWTTLKIYQIPGTDFVNISSDNAW